jgi:serine protease Do
MEFLMIPYNSSLPDRSNRRRPRRLTLLASVASLGLAVLLAGPTNSGLNLPAWTAAAQAAETTHPSAGFADLVTKVKPAVISVRVKIDETAKTTGMANEGSSKTLPFGPNTPFDRLCRYE